MCDGDLQISSLREGCGLHLQPRRRRRRRHHPPFLVQVPITSTLKLEVTGHSGRGVFAPPISSHAAPLRAVSLIIYQQDRGGGGPKERRCPAGDRPLNTSSVLLPHICQYTRHLSQRLPQNQSVSPSLRCFPLEIQQMASFSFSLSVCLSACPPSGLQTTSFSNFY